MKKSLIPSLPLAVILIVTSALLFCGCSGVTGEKNMKDSKANTEKMDFSGEPENVIILRAAVSGYRKTYAIHTGSNRYRKRLCKRNL